MTPALSQNPQLIGHAITEVQVERGPSRALTAAFLALAPLVYFFPAVMGKIALVPGDGLTQNLGVRILIGQMLRQGHLPLWNPYIFAGTPLLASIYPGAFYPPNWLFALFSPVTAMNIVVITTYHLTLIGTYLYARRAGLTRIGALVAGMAFTFGGYMIAHMGHTSRIAAAAWLPWILLAIEHLYQRARWRWVALGAFFIALQLFAGEPQMNFYTGLVCGAYVIYSLLVRQRRERRIRFLFATGAMAICGALLSMIALIPQRELLQMGERAAIGYEYFSGYSFPPINVLSFVFPFFFGGGTLPGFRVMYWGQETIDEVCGYFGLLTLALAIIAVVGARRRSLVWFWAIVAVVSLALSFGGYLPFELNHALHRTPVYNLFRASGRHMYEFTFSLGMLAGLGVTYLAQADPGKARRALRIGSVLFGGIVVLTAFLYGFYSQYLIAADLSMPAGANSLRNWEALVPLGFAFLSLAALWCYAMWRNGLSAMFLIAVLFTDLMAFGVVFNYGWRNFVSGVGERLQDSPTVRFIKSRESDLNQFRIVSYSQQPYALEHYDALNFPNVSMARGLQSVNGYDALRLSRLTPVVGEMGSDGLISDSSVFWREHQGFNLLNVKYLLRERPADPVRTMSIEGIRFNEQLLDMSLQPGEARESLVGGAAAAQLAIVSTMSNSVHVPDGSPVVRIRLHTKDGRIIERSLSAGRDTAEWAYDKPEVQANIKHRRPRVAESWPSEGFPAHRWLATFDFDRSEIERIEFNYLLKDASILILRASLLDDSTGMVTPLDLVNFQSERWRKLEEFGDIGVYENLKWLPRAWFVRRAVVESSGEVLNSIKTGRLKDGAAFDPAETVLFEREDFGNREITLPPIGDSTNAEANAEVKVTRYEPQRIELQTRNAEAGFVVLSEIYFRGWEAWVDGKRTPIERVNYILRGVALPAGEHRVEIVFRAHSFRNGAAYSGLGVLLLLMGLAGSRFAGRKNWKDRH